MHMHTYLKWISILIDDCTNAQYVFLRRSVDSHWSFTSRMRPHERLEWPRLFAAVEREKQKFIHKSWNLSGHFITVSVFEHEDGVVFFCFQKHHFSLRNLLWPHQVCQQDWQNNKTRAKSVILLSYLQVKHLK